MGKETGRNERIFVGPSYEKLREQQKQALERESQRVVESVNRTWEAERSFDEKYGSELGRLTRGLGQTENGSLVTLRTGANVSGSERIPLEEATQRFATAFLEALNAQPEEGRTAWLFGYIHDRRILGIKGI